MNDEDLRKQIESLIRDEIQETINDYVDSKEESKESGIGFVSTEEEKNLAQYKVENAIGSKKFILLNPDSKTAVFSTNKSWPLKYWNTLAKNLSEKGFTCVRARPLDPKYKVEPVENCVEIPTASLREAVALLSLSDCIVTTEGGMHHSAVATNTKAFVIVGGLSAPEVTGYLDSNQTYYTYNHMMTPCGSRTPCWHCNDAMESIRPEKIIKDVVEWYENNRVQ